MVASGRCPFRRGPGGWRAAEPSSECSLPGPQPWFSTTTRAWKAAAPTSASKGGNFTPTFTKRETDREVADPRPRSPREKIRGPGGSRRGGGQTRAPVRPCPPTLPPVDWWTWPLWVTQDPEPEPLGLSPPGPLGPLGLNATDLLAQRSRETTAGRGGASWAPETPRIELS